MKLTEFPIALGCMGLTGTWNPADVGPEHEKRAIGAFEAALEAGITLYDHADIYGGGSCEEVFKKCLEAVPGSRERISIATKGGIRSGHYNLSYEYLNECIERSLRRMGIEHIDVYQVHRPDPLTHPRETARALNDAVKSGKVLHVGVSNYYPEQVRALQTYLDMPLVSNQFQVHPLRLDPVYEGWQVPSGNAYAPSVGDGVLDQCMAMNMTPLAYSPLAGGRLTRVDEEVGEKSAEEEDVSLEVKVRRVLRKLATKYNATPVQISLAWLTNHPSGIVPLVGSANPDHIREAAGSANLKLEREDWYAVWTAGWNRNVP